MLTDTFCSIMNLEQDDVVKNDTAMQSYTLYFSEDMEKAYTADMSLSPFKQNELDGNSMPFLSIIQIHITTESLRRIKLDDSVDIIEQYQKDIADILEGFKKKADQDIFIYRVYKILSAGDFAVVVRSRLPETSFKISTLIRCRMAGVKNDDGKVQAGSWALYKTYTLLTFDETLINSNLKEQERGKFIIRGCYSCRYWAEETIKNTYKEEQVDSLNGRYDFSVQISENEFYKIYDYIKNYRRTEEIEQDQLKGMTRVQSFLASL